MNGGGDRGQGVAWPLSHGCLQSLLSGRVTAGPTPATPQTAKADPKLGPGALGSSALATKEAPRQAAGVTSPVAGVSGPQQDAGTTQCPQDTLTQSRGRRESSLGSRGTQSPGCLGQPDQGARSCGVQGLGPQIRGGLLPHIRSRVYVHGGGQGPAPWDVAPGAPSSNTAARHLPCAHLTPVPSIP